MPIEALTFDFWNTIAAEPVKGTMQERRRDAVVAACRDRGVEMEDEQIATAVAAVVRSRERSWDEGVHLSPEEGAWRLVASLGLEPATGEAIAEAFLGAGRGAELTLAPDIGETLACLRDEGIALGIACDAGFTGGAILREFLEGEGILRHFSGWGFSDEVGAYKPAPEIFAAALAMLDTEPGAAAHIGDLRRTDVAGARAVGMRTIRYRGLVDDPDPGQEADFVIDSHRELPRLVARAGRASARP